MQQKEGEKMSSQDNHKNDIEKAEGGQVEETKNHEDEYEKICFVCRRPETVTGKMIDLPNGISICSDCMQKSFDAMMSGQIDYSQLMNMNIPGVQILNMADMEKSVPRQQKIKKKNAEKT